MSLPPSMSTPIPDPASGAASSSTPSSVTPDISTVIPEPRIRTATLSGATGGSR